MITSKLLNITTGIENALIRRLLLSSIAIGYMILISLITLAEMFKDLIMGLFEYFKNYIPKTTRSIVYLYKELFSCW